MQSWIGRQMAQKDILTPGLLTRFRATLDSGDAGDCAAQGIHWCMCLPDAETAELDVDGHPRRGAFLPPVALPRRMWASSTLEFFAPIPVGSRIEKQSTISAIEEKQGGTGSLVFVTIDHHVTADDVAALNERQTIVYRGAASPAPVHDTVRAPDLAAWQWHRAITPTEPLLFRYSALTFNSHRIHYDRPYAVDAEGYSGLVVHGPLTATLLMDLAGRELGHNMLKHFSFRGQSPAFAGEELHLVGNLDGDAITLAALGADGRMVMSARGKTA